MTAMRVTGSMIAQGALANLQGSLGRSGSLLDKLSSGRQISRPSDSPSGTVSALQIRADLRAQERFSRGADDAKGWLGATDGALTSALPLLRRVRDLVLQGSSTGSNGPQAREALAVEVKGLREALLAVANTTYLGRPVFGGTTDQSVAYRPDGTYVGNAVDDGAGGFAGGVPRRLDANTTVRADTPGPEVFGDPDDSLFALLDATAAHLTGDTTQLAGDLAGIDTAMNRLTSGLASVGARYSRTELMMQTADDRALSLKSSLASIENIDLPRTVVDLQLQQVAYQAALGATAKVIQPTLMDFLR